LAPFLNGCQRPSTDKTASTSGPTAPVATKPAPPKPEPFEARALYITGWTAGGTKRLHELFNLIDKTPLNAVVIDVKDSDGAVSYKSDLPLAKEIMAKAGSVKEVNRYEYGKRVRDIDKVLAELKKRDIYPIARIAV